MKRSWLDIISRTRIMLLLMHSLVEYSLQCSVRLNMFKYNKVSAGSFQKKIVLLHHTTVTSTGI